MNSTTTTKFKVGDFVHVARRDPRHHNRVPRYARGAVGKILAIEGAWPLADLRAQGVSAEREPVYWVEFAAIDLFGDGDHKVTLDVWESWLTRTGNDG